MMPTVPSVLLVEDNPADARLLQEMVAATGEHDLVLRPCRRLADAIKAIEAETTDCVLLDLSLPDVTGLDGIDRLRERFPSMPIVILTGLNNEDVALGGAPGRRPGLPRQGIDRGRRGEARSPVRDRAQVRRGGAGAPRPPERDDPRLGRRRNLRPGLRGRRHFANPAAAKLLGCPREEVLGARFHDLVHPKGPLSDGHDAADCPDPGRHSRRERLISPTRNPSRAATRRSSPSSTR